MGCGASTQTPRPNSSAKVGGGDGNQSNNITASALVSEMAAGDLSMEDIREEKEDSEDAEGCKEETEAKPKPEAQEEEIATEAQEETTMIAEDQEEDTLVEAEEKEDNDTTIVEAGAAGGSEGDKPPTEEQIPEEGAMGGDDASVITVRKKNAIAMFVPSGTTIRPNTPMPARLQNRGKPYVPSWKEEYDLEQKQMIASAFRQEGLNKRCAAARKYEKKREEVLNRRRAMHQRRREQEERPEESSDEDAF